LGNGSARVAIIGISVIVAALPQSIETSTFALVDLAGPLGRVPIVVIAREFDPGGKFLNVLTLRIGDLDVQSKGMLRIVGSGERLG